MQGMSPHSRQQYPRQISFLIFFIDMLTSSTLYLPTAIDIFFFQKHSIYFRFAQIRYAPQGARVLFPQLTIVCTLSRRMVAAYESGQDFRRKAWELQSNGRTCATPRRSIFAFCANVRLRVKQNANHRPPLITPVLPLFYRAIPDFLVTQ